MPALEKMKEFCVERCMNSRNRVCKCRCGGRFHGKGKEFYFLSTRFMVIEWVTFFPSTIFSKDIKPLESKDASFHLSPEGLVLIFVRVGGLLFTPYAKECSILGLDIDGKRHFKPMGYDTIVDVEDSPF